jgi:hypothetical protein
MSITPSKNYSTEFNSNTVTTNDLIITDSCSFFGVNTSSQLNIDYSLDSIVDILRTYGFAKPNPWIQQGTKLIGTNYIGFPSQGNSICISRNGQTIVTGGENDNTNVGAVWIFSNLNGVWSQQAGPLIGTGYVGQSLQGTSVSISSDGNTVIVGGSGNNSGEGAVWIYTRDGTEWSQEAGPLVVPGIISQGRSVSISGDGNTAAVGCNSFTLIYIRTNNTWSLQTTLAVSSRSVSLSEDGNNLVAGLTSIFVYVRNSNIWTLQQTIAIPFMGASLSFSAIELDTFVVSVLIGSADAWVFTRSGTVWTQQATLTGSGVNYTPFLEPDGSNLSTRVAISPDSNTIILGRPGNDARDGGVWVFVRSGNVWVQNGQVLKGSPNEYVQRMGSAVSISGLDTLVFGAKGNITVTPSVGGSWVFIKN